MSETRIEDAPIVRAPGPTVTAPGPIAATGAGVDRLWFVISAMMIIGPALLTVFLIKTDNLPESYFGALMLLLLSPIGAAALVGLVVSTVRTRHRDIRLGLAAIAAMATWFGVFLTLIWILKTFYGWED